MVESWIGNAQHIELGFDGRQLRLDLFEPLQGLTLQKGRSQSFLSIEGGCAVLDECLASTVQFAHRGECGARQGSHRRFQESTQARQHGRVATIGLGQLPGRLGRASGLTWVDLRQRQVSLGKSALESPGRRQWPRRLRGRSYAASAA